MKRDEIEELLEMTAKRKRPAFQEELNTIKTWFIESSSRGTNQQIVNSQNLEEEYNSKLKQCF